MVAVKSETGAAVFASVNAKVTVHEPAVQAVLIAPAVSGASATVAVLMVVAIVRPVAASLTVVLTG